MKNTSTKCIVQTALFVALALVVRLFSVMLPIGGVAGMRIGVSEVFTKMPAILFGPVYGGAASGLVDFLSQVIKSEGAYLWPMLIVMILGGMLTGFLWKGFKKVTSSKLRVVFIVFCVFLAALGIFNHRVLSVVKQGAWYDTLLRLKENISFATYGLYAASLLGIAFVVTDAVLKRKFPDKYNDDFLQLTLTILISDIAVTTLNTFVLRFYYSGLARLPFWVVYVPRLIPDFVQTAIFAYIISCLLKIYKKISNNI